MSAIVLGNEYLPVDSTITAIMVRELIEGCMFCITHIGAVVKNDVMTREEKIKCLKVLVPSILSGFSAGFLISIFIAISIVYAVGEQDDTEFGVEVGEAVSRLIAAFFVTDLVFKIPKWFRISNYKGDAHKQNSKLQDEDAFGRRWEIGFSLWWNVLRESIEGGTLTAIAVILSEAAKHALGYSVLVAIAAAVTLSLIFALGAKYVSAKLFGVIAAILAQFLAMGLWTGSARAFEEVYALARGLDEDEGGTKMIYNYEGTSYGDSLTILEFLGFSYTLSALTLSVWLISLVLISLVQFWHNYLGYALLPPAVKKKKTELKQWLKKVFCSCTCCKKKKKQEDANNKVDDSENKPDLTLT